LGNKEKEGLKNELAEGDLRANEDSTTGLWGTVSGSFGLESFSSLSNLQRPCLTR